MTQPASDHGDLKQRLEELGTKSSQVLLFLSFAIVGAATLDAKSQAMKWAIRWWIFAVFPLLLAVLPVKEFDWNDSRWYDRIRTWKVRALWLAIALSMIGAIQFLIALR